MGGFFYGAPENNLEQITGQLFLPCFVFNAILHIPERIFI